RRFCRRGRKERLGDRAGKGDRAELPGADPAPRIGECLALQHQIGLSINPEIPPPASGDAWPDLNEPDAPARDDGGADFPDGIIAQEELDRGRAAGIWESDPAALPGEKQVA